MLFQILCESLSLNSGVCSPASVMEKTKLQVPNFKEEMRLNELFTTLVLILRPDCSETINFYPINIFACFYLRLWHDFHSRLYQVH